MRLEGQRPLELDVILLYLPTALTVASRFSNHTIALAVSTPLLQNQTTSKWLPKSALSLYVFLALVKVTGNCTPGSRVASTDSHGSIPCMATSRRWPRPSSRASERLAAMPTCISKFIQDLHVVHTTPSDRLPGLPKHCQRTCSPRCTRLPSPTFPSYRPTN